MGDDSSANRRLLSPLLLRVGVVLTTATPPFAALSLLGCESGSTPRATAAPPEVLALRRARRAVRTPAGATRGLRKKSNKPCCEAHPDDGAGCSDAAIETRVSNQDLFCSTQKWDEHCYRWAVANGDCPLPLGDRTEPACDTHKSTGATDATVSACVGALDPYCVTVNWDALCVSLAHGRCDAGCTENDDCCSPHAGAGCGNPTVQDCVEALDVYCTAYAWDWRCALTAANQCGLACTAPAAGSAVCCTGSSDGDQGCTDQAVQNCVCEYDSYCCAIEWDDYCVTRVGAQNCGACNASDGKGKECNISETPGTKDDDIEACVCLADPHCCQTAWDSRCVNAVDDCGGSCSQLGPDNDCCEVSNNRGCDDADVQACVCDAVGGADGNPGDEECCSVGWDAQCATHVPEQECGVCAKGTNTKDCCKSGSSGKVGCSDSTVQACVCALDQRCCTVEWDARCAAEVNEFGCGTDSVNFQDGTQNANFGAVPAHATDRTGWGQSVVISGSSFDLYEFQLHFSTDFGFDDSDDDDDDDNDELTLLFEIWDSSGTSLATASNELDASFTGGWVRFPDSGNFGLTLVPGTYFFFAWPETGPDATPAAAFNASIKYADATASTPAGSAYTMTGDKDANFNVFGNWTEDTAKDLDYRLQTTLVCDDGDDDDDDD